MIRWHEDYMRMGSDRIPKIILEEMERGWGECVDGVREAWSVNQ